MRAGRRPGPRRPARCPGGGRSRGRVRPGGLSGARRGRDRLPRHQLPRPRRRGDARRVEHDPVDEPHRGFPLRPRSGEADAASRHGKDRAGLLGLRAAGAQEVPRLRRLRGVQVRPDGPRRGPVRGAGRERGRHLPGLPRGGRDGDVPAGPSRERRRLSPPGRSAPPSSISRIRGPLPPPARSSSCSEARSAPFGRAGRGGLGAGGGLCPPGLGERRRKRARQLG